MTDCPGPGNDPRYRATHEDAMIQSGRCPAGCAKWMLPLTVVVPADDTAETENEPQRPFRAVRLFIPSAIAADLGVVDFKIANQSQFAASGEIDAQIFTEDALDTMQCFQPTWDTNKYNLQLRNKTGTEVTVNAAVLGYVRL